MTKRMLIDATHPEETRVVVASGNRVEEFDHETATKQQLKGNIYLAKVTRVEPSLQAAFVEYGGNRHGFLAFSEIHPDYYRIPVSDREDLVEVAQSDEDENGGHGSSIEEIGGDEGVDEAVEEAARRRPRLKRQYKIQEVVKRRQVLLVQVMKEERGTKGAALTTYLSLAGRYCVLMPNTARGGGVSRKITSQQDRKRLKGILSDLSIPDGMAVILRTAGEERSKAEIKRDYEYILKLWDEIRTTTLQSTAPALIYEEANLIRRAIRDLYSKDLEEVLVSGDDGYRIAKDFMKALIPSHAKRVKRYKDAEGVPLFQRYHVESQLNQIFDPAVQLRSGGSIVIHQTEALVAIDVNSGKSTRERHIEETAIKTNLEAAEEIARQLRLRDLAGLIVIDFIDMEENRNDQAVERKLKDALRRDRARIQVGRISPFGLLEMSRQRLRPSLLESMTQACPTCGGIGYIPSTESAALQVLRAIEEEGLKRRSKSICVTVPPAIAIYLFNHKRPALAEMEQNYGFSVTLETDGALLPPNFNMTRVAASEEGAATELPVETGEDEAEEASQRKRRKRGRRSKRRYDEEGEVEAAEPAGETRDGDDGDAAAETEADADEQTSRRRRRGRRGGRRRSQEVGGRAAASTAAAAAEAPDAEAPPEAANDRSPRDEETPHLAEAAEAVAAETESDAEAETQRQTAANDAGETTEPADGPEAALPAKAAKRPAARRQRVRKASVTWNPPAEEHAGTAEAGGTVHELPAAEPQPAGEPSPHAESEAAAAGAEETAEPVGPEPVAEQRDEVDRPKRSGWWNRVLGN